MAFAHLHCHTEYSLLDGATHIYDMVKRAADLDMPAVAITDHGVMSGVPELDEACRKVKNETGKWVKPIFGCEIYFTTDSEQYGVSQPVEAGQRIACRQFLLSSAYYVRDAPEVF